MSTTKLISRSTNYAPDIYRALNGILLAFKPPKITNKELQATIRGQIADSLNEFQPRPIANRLQIIGNANEAKSIVEGPNLADHPLVVGPRYNPWEISVSSPRPPLNYRSSGVSIFLLGSASRYYLHKINRANLVSVYHITGKFGYITDNNFADGKIIDKTTYHHVRSGKLDAALAKIESSQRDRIFDAASVPLDSQRAYELAKAWPSRPPKTANWPVIYRLRCIHLKPPYFKMEVTIAKENDDILASLANDVGLMLKTGAFTESIRRVKYGPFSIDDCLTDKDWNLQAILNNLEIYNSKYKELQQFLYQQKGAIEVRTEYDHPTRKLEEANNMRI